MNLKGRGGLTLDEVWKAGPRTYLGVSVAGFPNFFTREMLQLRQGFLLDLQLLLLTEFVKPLPQLGTMTAQDSPSVFSFALLPSDVHPDAVL